MNAGRSPPRRQPGGDEDMNKNRWCLCEKRKSSVNTCRIHASPSEFKPGYNAKFKLQIILPVLVDPVSI
jgi:hypothetical protein